MKKFTYYQCDKVQQKLHNFDNILNKYHQSKYQTQDISSNQLNKNYDNYRNKYIHVLPTIKKDNLYKNEKQNLYPICFYGNQQNCYENNQQLIESAKKKKQQYLTAYQNDYGKFETEKQTKQINRKENKKKFITSKRFPEQNKKTDIRQRVLNRVQQNYEQNIEQKNDESRLQKIKLQMQIIYDHQQQKYVYDKNKQKYESIHALDDQIKSIMQKYNYNYDSFPNIKERSNNFQSEKRQNDERKINKRLIKNNKVITFENQFEYQNENDKFFDENEQKSPKQSIVNEKIALNGHQNNSFNNIFNQIQLNQQNKSQNPSIIKQTKSFNKLNYLKTMKQRIQQRNVKNDRLSDKSNEVDRSIQKLNQKIKQVEKIKKSMNLPLKPFKFDIIKNNKNKQLSSRSYYHKYNENDQENQYNIHQVKNLNNTQKYGKIHSYTMKNNIVKVRRQDNQENQNINFNNQTKYMQSNSNVDQKPYFQEKDKKNSSYKKCNQKKLNKSIILRKKPQKIKNELQKLLINFHKQIQLDREFKQMKISLQVWIKQKDKNFQDQSEIKWNQLKQIFNEKLNQSDQLKRLFNKKFFTLEQLKSILTINVHEQDPFNFIDTKDNSHFCLERLFQTYVKTEEYWVNNVQNAFNQEQLQKNGMIEENIDLQQKGFIVVQDLVRFINMSTNTMFRSRDLLNIFQRLADNRNKINKNNKKELKKVPFKKFLTLLCN